MRGLISAFQSALNRLVRSSVFRNASFSYFAFFSTSLSGLVSIPIAVRYLSKDELGLWALINSILAYLIWMDLGVGSATGRKIADAVASADQKEIDSWWSVTRVVLIVQGLLVFLLGCALLPVFLTAFRIGPSLATTATGVYVGSVALTAASFPLRGVPGLLTAQDRFSWVPLGQGFTPWIQVCVFWAALVQGWGLKSYLTSMAAVLVVTWTYYAILVRVGANPPRFRIRDLSRTKLSSLFSFSLSISLLGMVEAFLSGLPALILARMKALSAVTVFNITNKAPQLITGLVRRTYHAFFPRLMRLHVTGERNGFRNLHLAVGKFVIGVGLAAAGTILALNACIVELLAGSEFFAGKATTVWFAVIVLLVPVCALFESLLQFSGSMGKAPLVATGRLIVGTVLSFAGYSVYGMPGLAAALATTPLFNAVYGYFRGAQKCGFSPGSLSSSLVLESALAVLLILSAGFFPTAPPAAHGFIKLAERQIPLPYGSEVLPGLFVMTAGIFRAAFAFLAFRRSQLRTF